MIKKIGVENFRVFKEFTEFEIRPLTLLVGPNNAGKSSFTKLLLLLKNDVNTLNFNGGLHNLESFKKVLNWDLNETKLKITFPSNLSFLDNNYSIKNEYIVDKDSNGKLFQIDICTREESVLMFRSNDTDCRLLFNIEYFIAEIYANKIVGYELEEALNGDPIGLWVHKYIKDMKYDSNESLITLNNFEEIFSKHPGRYSNSQYTNLVKPTIGQIVLKNTVRNLEENYLVYNIMINGKDATEYHKEELREIQKNQFKDIFFDGDHKAAGIPDGFKNAFAYCLKRANGRVKQYINNHFSHLYENDSVEIVETELGKILFSVKLFDSASEAPFRETNYQKTLFEKFSEYSINLDQEFDKIEYISANRASQKRVLANASEYDIAKIVVDFFNKSQQNISFLKLIFNILDIPGELSVERFENIISIVYLTVNDRKIALADVGFGFSQIIPIILKIVTLTEAKEGLKANVHLDKDSEEKGEFIFVLPTNEKTVIIEEPEANLHPNLQSKLADVFVEISNHYPELNFIIETHSEYMIRRLQYLTASNRISTDKSVIYYFNADKHVTANEPKVKAIEITSNGNLTDTFGPGFYDETSRLQFDLMKLNQEQSN
jgi:predicted ATPase